MHRPVGRRYVHDRYVRQASSIHRHCARRCLADENGEPGVPRREGRVRLRERLAVRGEDRSAHAGCPRGWAARRLALDIQAQGQPTQTRAGGRSYDGWQRAARAQGCAVLRPSHGRSCVDAGVGVCGDEEENEGKGEEVGVLRGRMILFSR